MAASKIRIYKENGIVHIVTTADSFPGLTTVSKPRVQQFPTGGELTASVVDTNKIKIEDSQGNIIVTNQLPSQFLGKTGSGQISATLAGVRDTLNGTGYFGSAKLETRIGSVESDVSTAQTDITALKNATKTTSGDRGVFVSDSKGTTSSHMAVTTSAAKLQAGGNTKVNLSETSPGTITLDVQAGSTGNETSVTAITIAGSSSLNNSLTTFNEPVDFDSNVTGLTTGAIPNLAASKITSGTFTTTRIPSLNASKLGSGTLADARVAVSNVTQHEASLSITESQISDLSHYTNASVDTHLNQSGASSGQYLKWTGSDYAWATISSGGLGNVVEDTSPQLGGDLDVNGNEIQSTGNVVVRVDSDNNTSLSKFVVKNGAGTDIYAIDEEGTTIATTGASSNIKIGNLDGGLSTFNGISLNNNLTYPGIVGFAGGSSSNDNFFCFGVVLDFRPDGVAGGLRMVKDSSDNAMVTINKGDSSSAPTTHTLYVGGNGKFDDNVDFAQGIDVTGNITVTGTVDGIDIGTDVAANTAKTSFPGFGTTAGTALAGNTSLLASLIEDTSPQLGGDLDVDGNKITSNSNGDVVIDPAGTGAILLKSNDIKFEGAGTVTMSSLKFYEATALDGNYVAFTAPLSIANDVTWTLPATDGTANQVIKTNGSGTLSFTTVVQAVNPAMQGTASIQQVGGLPAGLKIFDDDTSHGVRLLAPDLTADVDFTLPATDGSSGQVLKTDGSGNLSFVAQTTDTNTNLGNTDMTLSGSRIVTMGHDLNFKVGSSSKLLYDTSANSGTGLWQFSAPTQFLHDVKFNGAGGTTQASIKFNEPSMGGTNGVILQGPATNMTSDLTFTLPDSDGSAGQFLKTDGSGNLSFASAGGGGGASEIWLADMGGLYTWSSSDSGETVAMNLSYGEFFYSHSTELSQTGLRNYDSSQTIDSTTATIDNYKLQMVGFPVHTTDKKVRCDYNFRIQSAPLNSTWGVSIWGGELSASGSSSGERTMTLRGRASDITANPTTSTVVHHGSFTTTSTINGGFILPLVENRTGTLTTTTRIYGRFRFFLVD